MKTNQIILGLVGEKGAGKETFVKILKENLHNKSISHYHFSDILSQTLSLWNLPLSRINLQTLAISMVSSFGPFSLANAMKERMISDKSDIIIIDGIRWEADLSMLRSFPKNFLIYITASPQIRYQRIISRNEKKDEGKTTYQQFLNEEKSQTETSIGSISQKADITIQNETTLDHLAHQVKDALQQLSL